MFGRAILKSLMLTANLVVVFILLLTILGSKISPEKFIIPAYTTLFFPLTILANTFFVFFWIFARKWHFLISLVLLFIAAPQVAETIPLHFGQTKTNLKSNLTVLSYNTMLNAGLKKHTKENPNLVIQYIIDTDADIVCLQEFSISKKKEFLTENDILKALKKYPYHQITYKQYNSWCISGNATFSKFPIIEKGVIDYNSKHQNAQYSDIKIDNQVLRVFNVHLESNKLTSKDRSLPLELKDEFNTEKLSGTTRHLSNKLGTAYKERAKQADIMVKEIKKSPHKVIICGDFNDVPTSYAYTVIKKNYKDAFAETGFGLGWTYNESIFRFRIDYILYDKSIHLVNYKRSFVKYSDHFPIKGSFYISKI
jgi:endonuclease/exonuclease/phosphatase family metal-dependent hydrolase